MGSPASSQPRHLAVSLSTSGLRILLNTCYNPRFSSSTASPQPPPPCQALLTAPQRKRYTPASCCLITISPTHPGRHFLLRLHLLLALRENAPSPSLQPNTRRFEAPVPSLSSPGSASFWADPQPLALHTYFHLSGTSSLLTHLLGSTTLQVGTQTPGWPKAAG